MLVCTITSYAQTYFLGFACGAAGAIIMVAGWLRKQNKKVVA